MEIVINKHIEETSEHKNNFIRMCAQNREIENEINQLILSRVTVNDSYFYGEMFFSKNFNPTSFNDNYKLRLVLSLYNSTDFKTPYKSNDPIRKSLEAKQIILTQSLDLGHEYGDEQFKQPSEELIKNLFYDSISRYLCSELMKDLGKNLRTEVYNFRGN